MSAQAVSAADRGRRSGASPGHAQGARPRDLGLAQARIGWPFLGSALLLTLLVLLVYLRLPFQDFVFVDDPGFVFQNRHVITGLTLENAVWAFDLDTPSHWHPLTWLSLMFDAELDLIFGGQGTHVRPVVFKLGNLVLFTASVLLLYAFLTVATGRRWLALLVAAFFAVHPLNVETVAWVSERKAVLSMALAMAALLAYALHHRYFSSAAYLLSVLLFAAACLSNPLVLPLPALMLLLDLWPLQRFARAADLPRHGWNQAPPGRPLSTLLLEKIPFAAVALLAGAASAIAHDQRGFFQFSSHGDPLAPATNGLAATAEFLLIYPFRLFWPFGLTLGHDTGTPTVFWTLLATFGMPLLLLVITAVVLSQLRRRPYLVIGWLWYLTALAPLLGFVYLQVISHADRYAQLPMIGLWIALLWLVADRLATASRWAQRSGAVLAVAWVLALAGIAHGQVRVWQNTETLQTHRLTIQGDRAETLNSLAVYYEHLGQIDRAIETYQRALIAAPAFSPARFNLARLLLARGRYPEALHQADLATRLATLETDAGLSRVQALRLGASICRAAEDFPGAVHRLAEAWKLDPSDPSLAWERVDLLLEMGHNEEALDVMRQVTERHPGNAQAWEQYGLLAQQITPGGPTARTALMHATRLDRQLPNAWQALGLIALQSGDLPRAVWYTDRAVTLRPDRPDYLLTHAQALWASNRLNEAHYAVHQALAIDPHFGPAIQMLAALEQVIGGWAPAPPPRAQPGAAEPATPEPDAGTGDDGA